MVNIKAKHLKLKDYVILAKKYLDLEAKNEGFETNFRKFSSLK